MGATIAGIAIATIISAISGYMGSKAQAEAYEKIAQATEEEKKTLQEAYDQAYGQGSYNQQIQDIGLKATKDYSSLIGNEEAWGRYIDGPKAYQDVPDFSFTAEDLYSDPSYKTRLNEGLSALEQSLVAGGNSDSGYAQKAINNYAQEQASKEYQNAYNRAYTNYRDEKNFDYTAWKNEANQYYQNLQQQLSGLNTLGQQGQQASNNQTSALTALAGQKASAGIQRATAQAGADQANTGAYTSVLDAVGKGINSGVGAYSAYNYETPSSVSNTTSVGTATPTTSTTSLIGTTGQEQDDYAQRLLAGWNDLLGGSSAVPTTTSLTGA